MFIVISPAKALNFDPIELEKKGTLPRMQTSTSKIIKNLKKFNPDDISKLMKLSQPLSLLNFERYQNFETNPEKPCAFAFNGDTYQGLQFGELAPSEQAYGQKKLRILSGLYGNLRPFDLIKPHRLEMGTKIKIDKDQILRSWWQEKVTALLAEDMQEDQYLVNCASKEYFEVIDTKKLSKKIITPIFLDQKNGEYKMISFHAKKARGLMARFILKKKCTTPKDLTKFDLEGYTFCKERSSKDLKEIVFIR